ncbi:MAG: sulfatase-like hydrolase/transferase [Pirellulales bacterium]|nr:sulfatase-like hydrolase/transferase [Pirellulales bacterium]
MYQRRSIRLLARFMIATAAAACSTAAWAAPNIVVLFSDDAGYADFGFMSQVAGEASQFKTPNLDALAQQSTLFANAYVSSSVCAASRAGLLTGRAGARFGMEYNIANSNSPNDGVPTSEVLITEALKQRGYSTGVVGKWHVGAEAAKQPQNQGVDEFFGILTGGRTYFYSPGELSSYAVRRNTTVVDWSSEASFNNVPPDTTLGRHFTDALGDEASRFISTHANEVNPFFLYVPFNSPHSPYDKAKEQDLAEFDGTSLTGFRKNAAALTFGMDRAIGNILDRLDDPDGDGDMSDSIADNTIVVFLNDNGGAPPTDPLAAGQQVHDNGVLRGWKGSTWEGGIRTPMLMRVPGVSAGVFNPMVSSLDLYSTFLAAAGETSLPANLDGANLLPFVEGAQTGPVHDALYWRGGVNGWAIREGDWKLVRGGATAYPRLYNLSTDVSESTFLNASQPAMLNKLIGDFVDWEATLAKPTQTTLSNFTFNRFDAFQQRNDVGTAVTWRQSNLWINPAQPSQAVTMYREDSYANAVLIFQPRNDANYTSQNDISRASGMAYSEIAAGTVNPPGFEEYMLSELRFNGSFSGAANRSGTLFGYPLMFVKNLSGQNPRLVLDATRQGANQFAFNVNMDVVLHDSLEISGDSPLDYAIGGQIRDFRAARGITKSGLGALTLSGNNTYAGETLVNQGLLRIAGPTAALANTAAVKIGSQGAVVLDSGLISTPLLRIADGGSFQFNGGVLRAAQIAGGLTVHGGQFQPGLSIGNAIVSGDYAQAGGALGIEIAGAASFSFDRLLIGGTAQLGGQLLVNLASGGAGPFTPALGNAFEIINAAGVSGEFSSISVPALPTGLKWAIQYRSQSVLLTVVNQLAGDFDNNGVVNSADLQSWKFAFGSGRDGVDLLSWQRNLGAKIVLPSGASAVPEPAAGLLACLAAALWEMRRRGLARSPQRA